MEPRNRKGQQCPSCGRAGAPVGRITLEALLTPNALRRGLPAQPRFCGTADCPIVYFDARGPATFAEDDLRVRVHAKHPDDAEALVCYCFGVSAGAMAGGERARELREVIARRVQARDCACEVMNPKGGCCLGDLVRLARARQTGAPASCCAV